jgi:hypothetical protein
VILINKKTAELFEIVAFDSFSNTVMVSTMIGSFRKMNYEYLDNFEIVGWL